MHVNLELGKSTYAPLNPGKMPEYRVKSTSFDAISASKKLTKHLQIKQRLKPYDFLSTVVFQKHRGHQHVKSPSKSFDDSAVSIDWHGEFFPTTCESNEI